MSDTTSFFKALYKSIDADKQTKSIQNSISRNIIVYVKVEEKRLESIRTEKSSLLENSSIEGTKSIHLHKYEDSFFLEHSNNELGNSLKKKEKSENKESQKRFEEIIPLIDATCDINNISGYYSNIDTSTNKASNTNMTKSIQVEQKKVIVTKETQPKSFFSFDLG